MSYTDLAPTLSKYIPETTVNTDAKDVVVTSASKKTPLTESQVKEIYPYLKWIGATKIPAAESAFVGYEGYKAVAEKCGVPVKKVKKLHREWKEIKSEINKSL